MGFLFKKKRELPSLAEVSEQRRLQRLALANRVGRKQTILGSLNEEENSEVLGRTRLSANQLLGEL